MSRSIHSVCYCILQHCKGSQHENTEETQAKAPPTTAAVLMSDEPQNEQLDPFVRRVVTVHSGDRVVFKVLIATSGEEFAEIKAKLEEKMGDIPILVIGPDIDITVLKPPPRAPGVFIA